MVYSEPWMKPKWICKKKIGYQEEHGIRMGDMKAPLSVGSASSLVCTKNRCLAHECRRRIVALEMAKVGTLRKMNNDQRIFLVEARKRNPALRSAPATGRRSESDMAQVLGCDMIGRFCKNCFFRNGYCWTKIWYKYINIRVLKLWISIVSIIWSN